MRIILTDGPGIITLQSKPPRLAVALPRLVAGSVNAVPVLDALGAVGTSPTVLAPAGVRHHALALNMISSD